METRQRILDAAAEIWATDGFLALTLERVAEGAGLSKSGLFHYFDSKEALMAALIHDRMGHMEQFIAQQMDAGASYPEAFIEAMFCEKKDSNELMTTFLAAMITVPALRVIIAEKTSGWYARLCDSGLSEGTARMITFVAHGHHISSTLGVVVLTDAEKDSLSRQLKRAIQPSEDELLARLFTAALNQVELEPAY